MPIKQQHAPNNAASTDLRNEFSDFVLILLMLEFPNYLDAPSTHYIPKVPTVKSHVSLFKGTRRVLVHPPYTLPPLSLPLDHP